MWGLGLDSNRRNSTTSSISTSSESSENSSVTSSSSDEFSYQVSTNAQDSTESSDVSSVTSSSSEEFSQQVSTNAQDSTTSRSAPSSPSKTFTPPNLHEDLLNKLPELTSLTHSPTPSSLNSVCEENTAVANPASSSSPKVAATTPIIVAKTRVQKTFPIVASSKLEKKEEATVVKVEVKNRSNITRAITNILNENKNTDVTPLIVLGLSPNANKKISSIVDEQTEIKLKIEEITSQLAGKKAKLVTFIGDEMFYKHSAAFEALLINPALQTDLEAKVAAAESKHLERNFAHKSLWEQAKQAAKDDVLTAFCNDESFLTAKKLIVDEWKSLNEPVLTNSNIHPSDRIYFSTVLADAKEWVQYEVAAFCSDVPIPRVNNGKSNNMAQPYRAWLKEDITRFVESHTQSSVDNLPKIVVDVITLGFRREYTCFAKLMSDKVNPMAVLAYQGDGLAASESAVRAIGAFASKERRFHHPLYYCAIKFHKRQEHKSPQLQSNSVNLAASAIPPIEIWKKKTKHRSISPSSAFASSSSTSTSSTTVSEQKLSNLDMSDPNTLKKRLEWLTQTVPLDSEGASVLAETKNLLSKSPPKLPNLKSSS